MNHQQQQFSSKFDSTLILEINSLIRKVLIKAVAHFMGLNMSDK
jgi:hypothetical protein